MARQESEDRSRRVRRKHLELAELGRPAGQLGWAFATTLSGSWCERRHAGSSSATA